MRVLITGIDGFVGSHMAEFLLRENGVEIHGTVLDPNESRHIRQFQKRLILHRANILDAASIEQLLASVAPDRIIHLAGQAFIPTSISNPAETFKINVMGGVSILEASRSILKRHGKAPAVLIVSSAEVYGHVDSAHQPMTEELPLRPANPYAASKAAIDLIAQEYRHTFGVEATIVRPFNHVGPRQSPEFVCSDFARQFAGIALGKRAPRMSVGNLEPRRDFTDVRDVVRAYWLLFGQRSAHSVFNVCSAVAVSIREIVSILEEISGINVELVTEEQRIRANEAVLNVGSCDRLREATGWTPRFPIRQTLSDVFEYWKSSLATAA
jgi:GDP-4-dehydro-6-deoxy-D-mannose reductase